MGCGWGLARWLPPQHQDRCTPLVVQRTCLGYAAVCTGIPLSPFVVLSNWVAGWRPALAAGVWQAMVKTEPSTSGQPVSARHCWCLVYCRVYCSAPTQPLPASTLDYPAACQCCLQYPDTHFTCCLVPIPDLSEVVTRVGLAETELDLIDSLGVSLRLADKRAAATCACPPLLPGTALPNESPVVLAAGFAHLLSPSCPPVRFCRRRRCPTLCLISWYSAAVKSLFTLPHLPGGGAARHAARPAGVVRQRRRDALLGGEGQL